MRFAERFRLVTKYLQIRGRLLERNRLSTTSEALVRGLFKGGQDDSTGNFIAADSPEYIFVFDISKGAPQQKQVLTLPNSYTGIAFATNGQTFLAAGGVDDNVHIFQMQSTGQWADTGNPITLGHKTGIGLVSDGLALTAGQDPPMQAASRLFPATAATLWSPMFTMIRFH
jgi:hypothetical protein